MMWVGVAGAAVAALAAMLLKETPLRTTWEMPAEDQWDANAVPVDAGEGEGEPAIDNKA